MRKVVVFFSLLVSLAVPVLVQAQAEKITAPYSLKKTLLRGEELFRSNNYSKALIFYYEGLDMAKNAQVKSKLHFRIGECLEGIRRFDFATYHYKKALSGDLPDILSSRAFMKLEHLPELAQKEEANRLFAQSMKYYGKRNIRAAIDDYLESLRLMPSLMAKDESGLIEDAIKYLTYLSESKDKEPSRLLKLATLLELRGDVEKSVETLKQISIIYPETEEASQAEEKLMRFDKTRSVYLEPQKPQNALDEVIPEESALLVDKSFNFNGPGVISRELDDCAYTFKAQNDQTNIPDNRFEQFVVILGKGAEQKEFFFSSEDGIESQPYVFETDVVRYTLNFSSINLTRGYIQDLYGAGKKSVALFASLGVRLKIEQIK